MRFLDEIFASFPIWSIHLTVVLGFEAFMSPWFDLTIHLTVVLWFLDLSIHLTVALGFLDEIFESFGIALLSAAVDLVAGRAEAGAERALRVYFLSRRQIMFFLINGSTGLLPVEASGDVFFDKQTTFIENKHEKLHKFLGLIAHNL